MSADAETIRYHAATENSAAAVDLIDQTRLPAETVRLVCSTLPELHDAIVRLVVRGAPAIGIAAAYGVTLAPIDANASPAEVRQSYYEAIDYLATSRPTAVNLFWALDRMRGIVDAATDDAIGNLAQRLADEAIAIHEEDREMCRSMGRHGSALLTKCQTVLTHCNTGGLATSMYGTALAPIYFLHEKGHTLNVYADETRPLMQGARLTAWELAQAGVPVTVCTDSMAGGLMRDGKVDAVIVGSDRIAANGDVANKIGTYPLSVLARYHNVPFYVVAPTNTFDLELASGDLIPIEQRGEDEMRYTLGAESNIHANGRMAVPREAAVINPAFDVTPAELVTAIVTELGVIESPNVERVRQHFAAS
ncbi:S-methyl-5-thioribose-1-phosphate isomerase [Aporhodopirellula aestuarii]|uniref:Methylthioribose-1-phosphate isomerase n=1 Tax=Aporhodopirellula aestuarii TaxID=2950107 RepID=A0ABT0TWN6_9BACT|nr:S-methyl-5-thioribose-1-phosphate isomerase [Aporhodopirellula aestuarii]MCM2369036.1 S-methyl-5-thioribose-1-phosphate isomerase [Aporhodopirellula aestuarii]